MAGYKKPQGPRAIYHEEAKIYGSEVYTYNKIPRNAPPYVGKIGLGCIRDHKISLTELNGGCMYTTCNHLLR
jgi:hypothetical protein